MSEKLFQRVKYTIGKEGSSASQLAGARQSTRIDGAGRIATGGERGKLVLRGVKERSHNR